MLPAYLSILKLNYKYWVKLYVFEIRINIFVITEGFIYKIN